LNAFKVCDEEKDSIGCIRRLERKRPACKRRETPWRRPKSDGSDNVRPVRASRSVQAGRLRSSQFARSRLALSASGTLALQSVCAPV